jgi:uncharacterized ferritin-like protein (DUF455 family)
MDLYNDFVAGRVPIRVEGDPSSIALTPSRPSHVREIHPSKVKAPGVKGMLHSIIHAESYAMDLSWDIIVRYGLSNDMPDEFYTNWATVARDEAVHFTRWNDRLVAMGGSYGQYDCSTGLWDAATDSGDSLLSRLVLVHMIHEARGLDTANIALEKLLKTGDEESIKVLNLNVSEETHHVGFGVKWFKYLCGREGLDAVSTFHSMARRLYPGGLKHPFNYEARREAGMTPDWYEPLVLVKDKDKDKDKDRVKRGEGSGDKGNGKGKQSQAHRGARINSPLTFHMCKVPSEVHDLANSHINFGKIMTNAAAIC